MFCTDFIPFLKVNLSIYFFTGIIRFDHIHPDKEILFG